MSEFSAMAMMGVGTSGPINSQAPAATSQPAPPAHTPRDETAQRQAEAAGHQIRELIRDKVFAAKYASGDADARAKVKELNAVIAAGMDGGTDEPVGRAPTAVDRARERMAAIGRDPVLRDKYVSGDTALRQEVVALNETIAQGENEAEGETEGGKPAVIDPRSYSLPPLASPGADVPVATLAEVNTFIRGALSHAQFDKIEGDGMAKAAGTFINEWERLSPEARSARQASEQKAMARMWGADAGKKITLAHDMLQAIATKHPQVIGFVEKSGLGNSAIFIDKLARQAERLLAEP